MRWSTAVWIRLVLLVCAAGQAGHAQEFRGAITGRVTDPQDAVIPGAKIAVTQVETGARYQTVSNSDGQYALPFLAPGNYRLSAGAAGFKGYSRGGLRVGTNERVEADVRLEVGGTAETVTVSAEAPLLQTSTASLGQVINEKQVENMPLNGRSPMMLAQLAAGVVANHADMNQARTFDDSRQSNISIAGAPTGRNEMLMDGSPSMSQLNLVAFTPPVDAVAEVKVETFQADAAYGHSGGGTINMVTKSGTNQFRGSVYAYNQATRLSATPFFTNAVGGRKGVRSYNQPGLSAGGPVFLPRLFDGRNKVFFFFSHEAIYTRSSATVIGTVPSVSQRNGDFSPLLALGNSYQLYDPQTGVREGSRVRRQPFPGNLIPGSRHSAVGKNILSYYGMPNQPGRTDGTNNFGVVVPAGYNDFYSDLGRLDFNVSDSQKLFWNFRHNNREQTAQNLFQNVSTGGFSNEFNWGSTLDYVHAVQPTLVLNTRFNWSQKTKMSEVAGVGFDFSQLGFPASLAAASPKIAFPRVSMSSVVSLSTDPRNRNTWENFQILTSLTKVTGRHTLKPGADLRLDRLYAATQGNNAGSYAFGAGWINGPLDNSPAPAAAGDVASLLLGLPTGGSFDLNATQASQAGYYALFLQDDFRASARLTLNLGLRFERYLPTTERFNRSVRGFDFASPNPIEAQAAAAYDRNPIPEIPRGQFRTPGGLLYAGEGARTLYDTSYYFSPRAGFAWRPGFFGANTVLRGGAGVFFFPTAVEGVDQIGFSQSTPIVPSQDGFLTPYSTLSNPFPAGLLQPTGSALALRSALGNNILFTHRDRLNPYSVRWNLNVQRQLAQNLVGEVGYVGNHAVHLEVNRALAFVPLEYLSRLPVRDQAVIDRLTANVPNPFAGLLPGTSLNGSTVQRQQLLTQFPHFSGLTARNTPEGSSYFHMLQARVEKRFSHGVQFLGNYLWSKVIERTTRLNAADPFLEKRIALNDRSQRFVLSGSWDLPFGRGAALASNAGPVLNRILGGWNVNAIYTWQTGPPLTWGNLIYLGGDLALDRRGVNGAFDTARFNRNAREQLASNVRTFPSAFGKLRADGFNNLDASVIKRVPIAERVSLQLRFEFFNAMNHPAFGAPNLNAVNAAFGLITTQQNPPRTLQAGLRLAW